MNSCSVGLALAGIKEWQELIGGLLGFLAAVGAVWYTYRSEKRKAAEEAKALRQALGIEFRDLGFNALRIYENLKESRDAHKSMLVKDLVEQVRFVTPIIYLQVAGKIAAVGEAAYAVVHFHGQIEWCSDAVRRQQQLALSMVPADQRDLIIESLARALRAARTAIPHLEPIDAITAKNDVAFAAQVDQALGDKS